MYSAGEEFEKINSEGEVEEYTCLSNVTVGDKEYLVCDSETGEKKVFYYDSIEEELYDLDEDEEDQVLEIWNDEYYGSDKDYMYWNEDFGEYDKDENEDGEFNENNFDSLNDNDENEFFEDEEEKMNLSLEDIKGKVLVISQFTLYGNSIKGNRPSFIDAAKPDLAKDLYLKFIEELKSFGIETQEGEFGADMKVELLNDGPVTIIIDTKDANIK